MPSRRSFRTTVIGLSGGIASGKNFVAEIFAKNGAVIFDADREVHHLLDIDKSTIKAVSKNFPEVVIGDKIERKILGKIVFADPEKLKILEKILHPQVRKKYQKFVEKAQAKRIKIAVLNVPLLLESKVYKSDLVVAIIAPLALRRKRFLARSKNADIKIFNKIRAKQMSDLDRKKRADFVIKNDRNPEIISQKITKIISEIHE